MENNTGLTFKQEAFLTFRRDGEIVAIEEQPNGHIVRYKTETMTRAESMELFGADRVQPTPPL